MRLSELAIFTDDVDAAVAFYERLLGVPPVHRGDGIGIFRTGGVQVLIHKKSPPSPDSPPFEDHVAFHVPDVDQAVADLQARGLVLEVPPRRYDWGYSAYLRDPDGHLLELHEERG
jgi:catechol 2,3-dioxygenase-like lactoylglutathione lyase family enzyme